MLGTGLVLRSVGPGDQRFFAEIEQFLSRSAVYYPGIEVWWRRRIVPDLRAERVCHLAFMDDELAGLCIGKLSARSSKLCTLRVSERLRGGGIGEMLLSRLFVDASCAGASAIHFTISEPVDLECGAYFRNLGFKSVGWAHRRYQRAGDEHIYTAPMPRLFSKLKKGILNADRCIEQNGTG